MPLKTLVQIKSWKLERAERHLRQLELTAHAAHLAHERSLMEHREYQRWRCEEESRLFDLCQSRPLNGKQLEQWQQQVALLREKEANLEQAIAELALALEQEREHLKQGQQRLLAAQHQHEKFNQLSQHAHAQEREWLERQQEQQLDEFRPLEVAP